MSKGLNMQISNRVIFAVMGSLFFVAATFNTGYYHPDEHFQLIEFAKFKLGEIQSVDLPWEYGAMIRPGIQPFICCVIFKLLGALGVANPYTLALFLRLITAAISLAAISFFTSTVSYLLKEKYRKWLAVLSLGLWFIPSISVRFSSETWAGISFLVGLGYVLKDTQSLNKWVFSSIFFALSFLFRYQSAILVFSLLSWLIIVRKESLVCLLIIIVTGLNILSLGMLFDQWLYGVDTFIFWNYFKINILHSVASNFGTSPWFTILKYIVLDTFWPVGIPILLGLFVLMVKQPRSVFIWILIPFILIHGMIPHKELRFLFPVAWLIPIVILLAVQNLANYEKREHRYPQLLRLRLALVGSLVFVNCIALLVAVFRQAGNGEANLIQYVNDHFASKHIELYYYHNSNPYDGYPLTDNFYPYKKVTSWHLPEDGSLAYRPCGRDTVSLMAIQKFDEIRVGNDEKLVKLVQTLPIMIEFLASLYSENQTERMYSLYQYKK